VTDRAGPGGSADPYRQILPIPRGISRVVSTVALLWGSAYLGWRLTDSLFGAPPWLAVPLVLAELVSWALFAAFVHRAWREPRPIETPVDTTDATRTDVLLTTLNDPAESIQATLIGCHALDRPHKVWVLDDGDRPEIAALAADHGAEYLVRLDADGARAGNVNHALRLTDAPMVLLLRAGEVPFPDLLSYSIAAIANPRVGAVSAGALHRDIDSKGPFAPDHAERTTIEASIDAVDAAEWTGGPVLFRRAALNEIGGIARASVNLGHMTTMRLWQHGWTVRSIPLALAEVPAPANLTACQSLRDRWVRGRLEVLRSADSPVSSRGLTLHQRAAALGALSPVIGSITRIVMVAVAAAALSLGELPLTATAGALLALWLPAFVLRASSRWLLSDARLVPLATVRGELLHLGVHIRSLGTLFDRRPASYVFAPRTGADPSSWHLLRRVWLLVGASALLGSAMLFRFVRWAAGDRGLDGFGLFAMMATTAMFLALVVGEATDWARNGQRRAYYRRPVAVAARIDGRVVRVLDLVADGIGVESGVPLMAGERFTVTLRLPEPTGGVHDLSLTGRVKWAKESRASVWRAGIEFLELRPIERDRLIEFSAVTTPYQRVGRSADLTASGF